MIVIHSIGLLVDVVTTLVATLSVFTLCAHAYMSKMCTSSHHPIVLMLTAVLVIVFMFGFQRLTQLVTDTT